MARLDTILAKARARYNAPPNTTIDSALCLEWINEATRELAERDYFMRDSLVTIPADDLEIDLKVAIPGIRRPFEVTWNLSPTEYPMVSLKNVGNYAQLQRYRSFSDVDGTAYYYCLFGLKMIWANAPAVATTDALKVHNSYYPDDYEGTDEDPDVLPTEIPDKFYWSYIISQLCLKDDRRVGAKDRFAVFGAMFQAELDKLKSVDLPTDVGMRPGR